jgi:hypothetical protein
VASAGAEWNFSVEGPWAYATPAGAKLPEQGWKLHVPATVLTAGRVLRAVAPLLAGRGALYKAPASLHELEKLNSGLFYGYSQVGKFITVYPRTEAEAVLLAEGLRALTRGMRAPSVPFDRRYGRDGCVYYRYGAFKAPGGQQGGPSYFIRDPEGNLVADVRDAVCRPAWAEDPFDKTPPPAVKKRAAATPLSTTFRAFRALAQRGRGGVYQALDLSATPPRVCVLKEGRRHGETGWDGRDGAWRVRHEGRVLKALAEAGVSVPRLYASFKAEGNHYVAVELIEGESLDDILARRRRRLPLAAALRYGVELARLVARVHAAGWVWRDCKPANVIVTRRGELRPLDFEGACAVESPDPLPWGTRAFMPPECEDLFGGRSRLPEDLYSLGAVVYFLLAGRPPGSSSKPIEKVRGNVPASVARVLTGLLDGEPARRPSAAEAVCRLEEALVESQGVRLTRRARSAKRGSPRSVS